MSRALFLVAVLGGLAWVERRRPLRARTQPSGRRTAINLAMAGISAVVTGPLQTAVLDRATTWAEHRRFGLTRWIPLPRWLARMTGVILLDYTLWHWHRANHHSSSLWSMHAAHHADLDLDVSTALRFHVGEMLASVPVRAAQVIVLGIDRATLRAWQTALLVAIAFHHANVRLPARFESTLSKLLITPRLHGIHHAAKPDRLDTNFGTLLVIWDVLHGTRESEVEQADLAIGLPHTVGGRTPGLLDSLRLASSHRDT
ncbi:MAG: sterol desaturase family protein [Deltaproteobacteria bacterium]|nr:sterol desaturase family protein [Deltaproteobacteria bacterium]